MGILASTELGRDVDAELQEHGNVFFNGMRHPVIISNLHHSALVGRQIVERKALLKDAHGFTRVLLANKGRQEPERPPWKAGAQFKSAVRE